MFVNSLSANAILGFAGGGRPQRPDFGSLPTQEFAIVDVVSRASPHGCFWRASGPLRFRPARRFWDSDEGARLMLAFV